MVLTAQERAILRIFDQAFVPQVRFQQIAGALLHTEERLVATRALVKKGILARLADGEYWLTDRGLTLL